MKSSTVFLMLSLLASAFSEPLTIHAVSTKESKVGNCLFINQKPVCSIPSISRFKGSQKSITVDNLRPITLGIGLSNDCFAENPPYWDLKLIWSEFAEDSNIHHVWFRDDGCFWSQETDGDHDDWKKKTSSCTTTDFGVGVILEDLQQHRLCNEGLLGYHNFVFEVEESSRIGKDWTDLIDGPCGSSSFSSENPQEIKPNSETSLQPIALSSETESDTFLNNNENEDSILNIRSRINRRQ